MSSWNYRIVKVHNSADNTDHYDIYEVYYDGNGKPTSRTADPISFGSDDPDEVKQSLIMALTDCYLKPVLLDAEIGGKSG